MHFKTIQNKKNNRHTQHGFTLIEAMVAIAIFTIVMVIGISALLNINNTNKKSQNLRTIIDNVNFVMEDMSRNFKLGSAYHCVTSTDSAIVEGQVHDFLAIPQDCVGSSINGHDGSLIASLEPMSALSTEYADSGYPGSGSANAENQVVYWFDPAGNAADVCTLKKSVDGGRSFVSMLPVEIQVSCSSSGFNVYNTAINTFAASPRILIRISGKIVYKETNTPFAIQTSATQRNMNVVSP
jgi:prepilin-type N-terminal cleavage/methylation domain-containing protein